MSMLLLLNPCPLLSFTYPYVHIAFPSTLLWLTPHGSCTDQQVPASQPSPALVAIWLGSAEALTAWYVVPSQPSL
ncbi:uncharacterized protein BDZ83DRAFT_609154 [Colletotrichum acutatum]|uniref:Uncharacterized protein n=1 Tax=Glomerella acutata TaxID=27357 RepID=A0AAD8XJL4_GLOAC|nr:uncharacterized protein BDZ83DRAFT_609154 [Colletotrichum acutatum]KAK1728428.1 hypothetical protein BDZ83DRAFT_609154 [Colletotrichum acutatum]